jgi:hypothetical protein
MTSAHDVFAALGKSFGTAVRRIPDGETGDRLGWLEWREPLLARSPLLEATASEGDWRNATTPDKWKHKHWFRLRADASVRDVVLGDIGYGETAPKWDSIETGAAP